MSDQVIQKGHPKGLYVLFATEFCECVDCSRIAKESQEF